MMNVRQAVILAIFVLSPVFAVWGRPGRALAEPPGRAPSLQVPTDPDYPYYVMSLTVDPIGVVLGRYAARADIATTCHHGLWLRPGFRNDGELRGLFADVGYALYPFGDGTADLLVGAFVSGAMSVQDNPQYGMSAGLELAYHYSWDGILVGASVSVERIVIAPRNRGWLDPRFGLAVGYAFR